MILIADSGSTKTDWTLVDAVNKTSQYKTAGFNPYFQSTEDILKELRANLLPHLGIDIASPISIFFYGAGCSSEAKCKIVQDALIQAFPGSKVDVEHDLLAAARALCGKEEGVASILGTGSNSCYYDGREIKEHVFSLGYILGDEGSGAYLGKKLLQHYLYGELPAELHENFVAKYRETREEMLDNIYKKPLPSRYLASYSRFLLENISHPFVKRVVSEGFEDFFNRHICKYTKYREIPFHCVGSVGFRYKDILTQVAESKGISVGKIIETPIQALTSYHTESREN
jgi:glucosamine kinase